MKQHILDWVTPIWHPDFGNPEIELSILKKTCIFIQSFNNDLTFFLDCYEDGYKCIEIKNKDKLLGELHVVDSSTYRIGFFNTNGDELYFSLNIEN